MRRMRQASHALMPPRCPHRVLARRLYPLSNRIRASLVHSQPPLSGNQSTLQRRLILRTFFLSKNHWNHLQLLALSSLMLMRGTQALSHASSARRKVVSASIVGTLCSRTVTLSLLTRGPTVMDARQERASTPMHAYLRITIEFSALSLFPRPALPVLPLSATPVSLQLAPHILCASNEQEP